MSNLVKNDKIDIRQLCISDHNVSTVNFREFEVTFNRITNLQLWKVICWCKFIKNWTWEDLEDIRVTNRKISILQQQNLMRTPRSIYICLETSHKRVVFVVVVDHYLISGLIIWKSVIPYSLLHDDPEVPIADFWDECIKNCVLISPKMSYFLTCHILQHVEGLIIPKRSEFWGSHAIVIPKIEG